MPFLEQLNNTTYSSKLHLDDVEIGDIREQVFKPHIKMKRFNGLCDLAISYPTTSTGLVVFDSQKVVFNESNELDIEIHTVEPDNLRSEGAVELDFILKKKPRGNTISLKVETDTIDFQKILGLDVEFDQSRCIEKWGAKHPAPFTITPTSITDSSGEVLRSREEYLVNSYKGRAKQNYHIKKDYGKITVETPNKGKHLIRGRVSRTTAHLRRGKMVDADGVEAWVEDMNLVDKTLTFTLPKEFLRTARYPIHRAIGLDPSYTEDMDTFGTGQTEHATNFYDYDIFTNKDIPKNSVVEIIITNDDAGNNYGGGIRTDGSVLSRQTNLHEAEGGGAVSVRMFALVDSSTGLIETSQEENTDIVFTIVGYWQNVSFTENWWSHQPTSGSWQETQLNASGAASRACHFVLQNNQADTPNTMGVRTTDSAVNRYILTHEPEAGGYSVIDMITKADADYKVDFYTTITAQTLLTDAGYFGDEVDFTELFQSITNDGDGDWDAIDLTTYLDQDGRVCDFFLGHNVETAQHTIGVRDGDDAATNRYILEHEAEPDNGTSEVTGFGISAQSNSSGVVNLYSSTTSEVFYLMGYFVFEVTPPEGWAHKYLGVANAAIGKINGVAIASIGKVNGVA